MPSRPPPREIADMTQQEIIGAIRALPGVAVVTASAGNGAPEVAWGDSFFFYDPDDHPAQRRFPFATLVVGDYEGFDTASRLNRPGVFRVNVSVGRERFEELIGYPPSQHDRHADRFDFSALDHLLPHPAYAAQSWVSILNPGERTGELATSLLAEAHARAANRHRPAA